MKRTKQRMWSLTKKIGSVIAAVILITSATVAQAQDDHPAQVLVETAITDMLTFLAENVDAAKADPSILQAKVDEVVVPHIDFETMTRLSIGKNWRMADEQQQVELVSEFKSLLLNTYTTAMTQYGGEEVKFERFRPESREDRAEVRSAFMQSGSSEVPVIYKLREKNGWTIYDIEVAGLSLVNNFRQTFTDKINADGIDGLLAFLKERNQG